MITKKEFVRHSKDKICDKGGEKFLEFCEMNSLDILNGKHVEDKNGEFTFLNNNGKSVIDYILWPGNMEHMLNNFRVLNFSTKSSHFPLVVDIRKRSEKETFIQKETILL